jgi:alanine-synthesizing transaminase
MRMGAAAGRATGGNALRGTSGARPEEPAGDGGGRRVYSPGMPRREIVFSRRLPWAGRTNRLARAVAERAAGGLATIDLTVTNPTRVGLAYPDEELAELLRRGAAADYPPHPLGLPPAREALAAALSTPGDAVAPDDLVLTASTSEAYSYLFKLFGDAGGEVLTAVPSYPLLDSLAALDALALRHFALDPGRRFGLDAGTLGRAFSPRTRLLVVVHPGNPTGSFLTVGEQDAAAALCAERGVPLVSDEVFFDYVLEPEREGREESREKGRAARPEGREEGGAARPEGGGEERAARPAARRAGPAAARGGAVSFSLGGLSKSAGLPSWKLGWIRVGGPPAERRRVVAALELLADSYLSVATPVQRALPGVLELAPRIRAAILARLRGNLAALVAALGGLPAVELLAPQGGWSAVVRVPRLAGDEELALGLLARAGVLVHPGYFFDFAAEGYLVLSLLPEPGEFNAGAGRLAEHLREIVAGS